MQIIKTKAGLTFMLGIALFIFVISETIDKTQARGGVGGGRGGGSRGARGGGSKGAGGGAARFIGPGGIFPGGRSGSVGGSSNQGNTGTAPKRELITVHHKKCDKHCNGFNKGKCGKCCREDNFPDSGKCKWFHCRCRKEKTEE